MLISAVIKHDRAIFLWPWNENARTKQKQQANGNKAIWLVYRTDTNAPCLWLVKRTLGWKNFMPEELSRNRFNVILQNDWSIEQCFLHIRVFTHVAFSLTWPASMLIEKKENVYVTKEYNSQSIFWYTNMAAVQLFWKKPIWPPWRHVKTLLRDCTFHIACMLSTPLFMYTYKLKQECMTTERRTNSRKSRTDDRLMYKSCSF